MRPQDVRADLAVKLRPPSSAPVPCKVCGGEAGAIGATDFNRACAAPNIPALPKSGVPVGYRRCGGCGLIFTDAFDDWSREDFETHIYNDGYAAVDPECDTVRPELNARLVENTFAAVKGTLRILDYGGANGRFAEALRASGFSCETYDPIFPRHRERPAGRFNLVTCFETLEHMPDPMAGAADIAAFLDQDDGMILFSTLLQPADIAQRGLGWWYVGPRNGHVTLFSHQSLDLLWRRQGLRLHSFNDNVHAAFRAQPAFARHLLGPRDQAPA